MRPFQTIFDQAADRKGGADALEAMLTRRRRARKRQRSSQKSKTTDCWRK